MNNTFKVADKQDSKENIQIKHDMLKVEKQNKEKNIVELMIKLYCRKKHKSRHRNNILCKDCEELLQYAFDRIDKCPFMEEKTFCSCCKVHCYKQDMRTKIQKIMKWSGPRMMIYHPLLSIKHIYLTIQKKSMTE